MPMDQSMLNALSGIRVMPEHSHVEDEATTARLMGMVTDAPEIGALAALEKYKHDLSYMLDERRSKYIALAEIGADHDVLEIGSSMGQHTRLMAPMCKHISGLEIVPLQAAFSKVWCDEDGHKNVDITTGGANGKLPYDDASFDRVVCNYVLEWCAGRSEQHPAEFHRDFIAEMHRVLRPGGKLMLTTKNRYAIRYIVGGKDEHLGVRFGSALPRGLAAWARKRGQLDWTPGYLHSWSELEAIIKRAGFASTERFLTFPDNRYAHYAGTFEGFNVDDLPPDALDGLPKKEKMVLKLPQSLFAQTTNSLVFLAGKSA